jgi:CAP-Gly domain-containing linker protein 1
VWVAGSKPGAIAFIGETQFAAGEWAGVILDAPIGKNDGSVAGVRYFSCKPLYGIFSKLSNLSHCSSSAASNQSAQSPTVTQSKQRDSSASNDSGVLTSKASSADELPAAGGSRGRLNVAGNSPGPSEMTVPTVEKVKPNTTGIAIARSSGLVRPTSHSAGQATGLAAIHRAAVDGSERPGSAQDGNLQLGCRVIVSGNKIGTLRYLGTTHFAKGEWAGVELDEPQGKNDGSVEGKR